MSRNSLVKIVIALAAAALFEGCGPVIHNIRNVVENPRTKYQRPYYEELGTQGWRTEQQKKNWYFQPLPYKRK